MRRAWGFLAMLLLAGCKPAPEAPATAVDAPAPEPAVAPAPAPAPQPAPLADPGSAWERRLGNLPPDAAAVVARVEACAHFAGEFNGDRSERDRDVAAKMTQLRCAAIDADAGALRAMYGDRPDVMEALDMATDGVRQ